MDYESIRKTKKNIREPINVTFFNRPFCNSVKTKVGKQFFNLLNMHFLKNSKLSKIFDQNTIKMSYSCLLNMKNIINSYNWKILKVKNLSTKDCNCKNKTKCPFNGYCLEKGIYKATIYCPRGNKEYLRSAGVSFKSTFNSISIAWIAIKLIRLHYLSIIKQTGNDIS